jgi:hypothetical protein
MARILIRAAARGWFSATLPITGMSRNPDGGLLFALSLVLLMVLVAVIAAYLI